MIDSTTQISSVGVTSRYFDNETGEEKLSASLGQIYYFRDRAVRLNAFDPVLAEKTSPLAGEFSWSPNQNWKLRASALYDTNDNTFDAASAQATYFPWSGAVLSAGYTLREPRRHSLSDLSPNRRTSPPTCQSRMIGVSSVRWNTPSRAQPP